MQIIREINHNQPNTSIVQHIFRIALGMLLLYTGAGHLTFSRKEFLAQVPNWVPLEGDLVVVLSGTVEIILGVVIIAFPKYKAIIGWLVALFFIVIFPGNISQYTNRIDAFGLDSDSARFARLFLQPVFIIWALWSSGGWIAWRNRTENR